MLRVPLRIPLRNLRARPLRALATLAAVVVGVALVSGTYVLTDTIDRSFERLFRESQKGADVVVTARQPISSPAVEPPTLPASLLARVRAVPGVRQAVGGVVGFAKVVDDRDRPLGRGFAPNFIGSVLPRPFEWLRYVRGRAPSRSGEAAIDEASARFRSVRVGERIGVVGERGIRRFRVVGITRLGAGASLGGAVAVTLTLADARAVTGKRGRFDQLLVRAAPGVTPEELRTRLASRLGREARVETLAESVERQAREVRSGLSFLRIALLVFAGVAVVVGGFLIFNTFSITVAQRTAEFGLLRTLGAARGQLLGLVIAEALALGVLGAGFGVALGIASTPALDELLGMAGLDLPNSGPVVRTRSLIVGLAVGLAVTLVAVLVPAIRATRIPPLAALRLPVARVSRRARRRRRGAAAALLVVGALGLTIGALAPLASGRAALLVGAGALALLVGLVLAGPLVVVPVARVLGAGFARIGGLAGRLARENALRQPGRTAVSATALMIGLALVVFVAVFAAGINASAGRAIETTLPAPLEVQSQDGFTVLPLGVEETVRRVRGVGAVAGLGFSAARIVGIDGTRQVSALDTDTPASLVRLRVVRGSERPLAALARGQVLLDERFARSRGIAPGRTVTILTPRDTRFRARVAATVEDDADVFGDIVVSRRTLAARFGERRVALLLVEPQRGVPTPVLLRRLRRVLERKFPTVQALDQRAAKRKIERQVNQLAALVYVLLAFSILVSVLGIVNALALSVLERTRELGLLRAVGMSRRQLRTMVLLEAVLTALIGATLGIALGCVVAAAMAGPLASEGFVLAWPVAQLLLLFVLAALAGLLAALAPARRAARVAILEALAYE